MMIILSTLLWIQWKQDYSNHLLMGMNPPSTDLDKSSFNPQDFFKSTENKLKFPPAMKNLIGYWYLP